MLKTAIKRNTIILGFLALKAISLPVLLMEEPPLEADIRFGVCIEAAVVALLGVLAMKRYRIPSILLGGHMVMVYGLLITLALWEYLSGGYFPPFSELVSLLIILLIVFGGYHLIRMELRELKENKAPKAPEALDEANQPGTEKE